MLDISAFRLVFRGAANATLPRWLGSTWRGAMGHALKRTACRCGTDAHDAECVYSQLFETPVPGDAKRLRKYPVAPHPYILRPHTRDSKQPEVLVIDALLLGNARAHSRVLLNALTKAASSGLGASHACYVLDKLQDISIQIQPEIDAKLTPHSSKFKITFLSPQIVKYRGQIMDCNRFDLTGWLTNLMRRYNSLRYFHGDGVEPTDTQVESMLDAFRQISVLQHDLRWHRAVRHSSRQQKHIDQSGLMGNLDIDLGAGATLVLPLLLAGTNIHVGKSAVMGHGQFKIESVA